MADDPREALAKELHDLPSGWRWRWQDEVFDFRGGAQPPASTFVDAERPGYVRLVQIRDYYTNSHRTYVPDSSKLRKCTASDVMIARYGSSDDSRSANSLGRICRGLDGAYNVALAKAIPAPDIERSFLFYLLKSDYFQAPLVAQGARSVQAGFNKSSLRVIPLPVPPLPEQRAIAHILGTLDDKIELNRRMGETLEAMARALFKSWFVDFDPVRARMEGRDPGLPPHLAGLFPDSFEESELGEIPAGWEVGVVGDQAKFTSGKRPDVRFVDCSRDAPVPLWGGNGPMAFVAEPLFDEPLLLTGRVGTLGSVFRITEPCWPSDNTLVIFSNRTTNFEYLFFQLQLIDYASLNRGSTQPLLTQSDLKAQPILLPDPAVLDRFSGIASSIHNRIDQAEDESRTLAALRDSLLPRVISGQLRVPDAERVVGAAG